MSKADVIDSLKWYLAVADAQRVELHHYHSDNPGNRGLGEPNDREHFARIAAWYAALYVVLEGWKTLVKLPNERLDSLLAESPKREEALKRFRNKTVHAQKSYPNAHLLEYVNDPESVRWAYRLDDALTQAIFAASHSQD